MTQPEYGTLPYFQNCFEDILSAATEEDNLEKNLEKSKLILSAFKLALESWMEYHLNSTVTYDKMLQEFLNELERGDGSESCCHQLCDV
jgi:hypothetical protein